MKRRSVLQFFSAASAASVLAGQQPMVPPKPAAAAVEEIPVIEASIPDAGGNTVASFFTARQFSALRRLSDLIVPAMNDVPGAVATRAPEFLDFLIGQSPMPRQKVYCEGLDQLNSHAERKFQVSFAQASPAEADLLLAPLRLPWSANQDQYTVFLVTAKADIIRATQNSEDWIQIMSKRVRSASGLGTYWFPIE